MKILVLVETNWVRRGPLTYHHIFERLSRNPRNKIIVLDYDIDKVMKDKSLCVKKQIFDKISRAVNDSRVKIIRTAHLQISYFRRISSLITNLFQILSIIRKNPPDYVVSYSLTNGLIGLLVARIFRIPFIFHYIDILHTLVPIPQARGFARVVERLLFRYSDLTIVVTKLLYKFALRAGAPPKKLFYIPNGVSLNNTKVNKEKLGEIKTKYSINQEDFTLFFMGHLYEFAGLKEIIQYYNDKIRKKELNLKFIILGDGGIYNLLKNYVKQIGADWVILVGRVPYSEITEYLELADLCLLSFKLNDITKNITPIKILEYMAMKKPVLSNSLPSVKMEIGENSGVIFAKNQEDLIRSIENLVSKKAELEKKGKKGYRIVISKYKWEKLLSKFLRNLYKTLKNQED